ncbi:hypothetical protein TWF106_002285 [Orbilia oligospora]|uniref:Uncharacterized protein n=1 Tax=Orbilia oligospora TaxID=2813651 RepID=A0A6G1MCQ0_ORBOL|nr:hypothetical protein TWF106_002285 [Orbilia oligospora]KAF3217498.1 hypothetical protein TWF191_008474 [Orbilia oligospora]KAF3253953.1 hypothetical protein TWF192_003471 [Orbilia oligospora]
MSANVTIRGFVTSAMVIERSQWKIRGPINWDRLDTKTAIDFIKSTPARDRRTNMEKNRFRILLVQSATLDRAGLFKQSSILKAAKEANWIGDEFLYFLEKGTTGSAVVETENHTSFIVQTPKDDLPYFSLALTELNNCRSKSDADWGCILFTDRGIDLENLICNIQFPSDFSAPLPPDFMFLPACLLQWQVQETRDQVNTLSDRILAQDDKLAGRKTEGLESMRSLLFQLEKLHLTLYRRWSFEQDLAAKLLQCFQTIERSASKEEVATYSRKLCQQVRTQNDLSGTLKHDLDTIPGKLKFQHGMIDSQISIMIAKNSEFAATAARKDSSFMRTIAIITLIFLPGTFVAAVFSMSMFNWEADGSVVVSKHIWMYFAITVPLTTVVVISWLIWTIKSEKDYNKKVSGKIL